VRHCAGRPRLSVPDAAAASFPPLPPTPTTSHRAPLPPGPACQPLAPSQPRPAALPCRATAPPPTSDGREPLLATPHYRPLRRAPLRSFSCPHEAPSKPPSFSLAAPRIEHIQKPPAADLAPLLLHFLLHPHRAPLPPSSPTKPVHTVPCRLTTSAPGNRDTADVDLPPPPLGESGPPCVVDHKWRAPHLLPLLRYCRTPPLVPPVTGAPPPPCDIAAPPLLHPRTSSCCSGEPSLPPPCQAHCLRPHGAHATVSGTPCPQEHAG
jgi:hypothetical protein